MKKVGIITLYYKNYNYGGLLQTYALQHLLKEMGVDAVTISYEINTGGDNFIKNVLSYLKQNLTSIRGLREIAKQINYFVSLPWKKIQMRPYRKSMSKKWALFDEFMVCKIKHTDDVYVHDTLREASLDFDAYVTGSDQVFHPSRFDDTFFLGFVPDRIPKFAYAASIGRSVLTIEQKKYMGRYLQRFHKIGVRENTAKELLQPLLEREVEVVLDPTLIMNRDQWRPIVHEYKSKTPYMLVYLLGDSKGNKKRINSLSKALRVPIVYLPLMTNGYPRYEKQYGDTNIIECGPSEFLGLIESATYICTDSFHGLVFSIVFEKRFLAFLRDSNQSKMNLNDRVMTLLKESGLQNRIAKPGLEESQMKRSIDYNVVQNELGKYKRESKAFLEGMVDELS